MIFTNDKANKILKQKNLKTDLISDVEYVLEEKKPSRL
jgi:hypothetical protein